MNRDYNSDELYALLCAPLAPRSEYRPGDQASYQSGAKIVTGEVLYVSDGSGGQLYIIENQAQGFPDVVRGNELREPRERRDHETA